VEEDMFIKLLIWLGLRKVEAEKKFEEVKAEATAKLDVNKDGKVNAEDVKAAVATKTPLDVNKDGKVNIEDAKAAVEEVKAEVKAKVTRKPRAPKVAAPASVTKGKRKTK
jgi:hypothetical protein